MSDVWKFREQVPHDGYRWGQWRFDEKSGALEYEGEYQVCRAWLNQANEETILHPLDDSELEIQRQRIKGLVAEYEENWWHSAK